jgi:hypothetical protein
LDALSHERIANHSESDLGYAREEVQCVHESEHA